MIFSLLFKRGSLRSAAFTLIELLVVISIIGVLSSIVLASLNAARSKGVEASIKSNLRNMIAQAEILYDSTTPNNYSGACAGVAGMLNTINISGGTAACYSHNVSGDVNTRWGAFGRLNSVTTTIKGWSVDSNGIATWDVVDAAGSLPVTWDAANTACAALGGRLPPLEQLKALRAAYGVVPPTMQIGSYWSGTTDPNNSANAYYVFMLGNSIPIGVKATDVGYVRCVR